VNIDTVEQPWLQNEPIQGPAHLVLATDYPWTDDFSWLRALTCINHPTAGYLTKNPWERSVHIWFYPKGPDGKSLGHDCPCPSTALAVIVVPGSWEERDLIAGRIAAHKCDPAKHLVYEGEYGAPGYGQAWRCAYCDAPWSRVGDTFFMNDPESGEPVNILNINDVR